MISLSKKDVLAEAERMIGPEKWAEWRSEQRESFYRIVRRALESEALEQKRDWRKRMDAALSIKSRDQETAAREIEEEPVLPEGRETGLIRWRETTLCEDHESHLAGYVTSNPNPLRTCEEIEAEYHALAAEQTGNVIDDERQWEIDHRRKEVLRQSLEIAERLESVGVNAFRETPYAVYRYAVHSCRVEKLPSFRRIAFIPAVAQSIRAPVVSALEYFLERHPLCRFWTFTSGPRCAIPELRDRARELHRRISKLNDAAFMRSAGARIVFRATEFGTPETDESFDSGGEIERDIDGRVMLHPHAHCVVFLEKGPLRPRQWAGLLKNVWTFWGDHWDEGSTIRNARELCKYVTKPSAILDLSAEELAALAHQSRRLKLVQSMGLLARQIRDREEHDLRLVSVAAPDGSGRVRREVRDWNKRPRRSLAQKTADMAQRLDPKKKGSDCFVLLARSLPTFCGAGATEPTVTIMATRFDARRAATMPAVQALVNATAAEWLASLFIRVHTSTPTVRRPKAPPDHESQRRLSLASEPGGFSP